VKRIERVLQILILLSVIYYTQFYKLGSLTYRIWDEARLATSAYEMSQTGNLIVPTFEGESDMWSTKPPLMIWTQAVLIRLHGITETAIRLPAAISGAFTCILVFLFAIYLTKNRWIGVLSTVMLCTFNGYIGYHGVRNGDYDAMLTLFTTASLVSIFLFCNHSSNSKRNWFLLLFFVSTSLGILTKSVAALLFLPSVSIYLLFSGKTKELFCSRYLHAGIFVFVMLVGGYYLIREYSNPGYFHAVYENELGGRFLKTNEEHNESFFFYFDNFYLYRLKAWLWFFPAAAFFLFLNSSKLVNEAIRFSLLNILAFLLIISSSKTKLPWYDLPVYPLIAVLLSLSVFIFLSWMSKKLPNINQSILTCLICSLITFYPFREMYNMIKWEDDYRTSLDEYAPAYYLRDMALNSNNFQNYIYFYDGYCPQFTIYVKRMNDLGAHIKLVSFSGNDSFAENSKVIAHHNATKQYIEAKYENEVYEEVKNVRVYVIKKAKS